MKTASRKRVIEGDAVAPDSFRRQHGGVTRRKRTAGETSGANFANEAESPLAWIARRKGPDGKPFISLLQLAAGERLRTDFTRAGLTPRVTANWAAPIAHGRRGPEFSGLLLDVCCFLKGLETVERERRWPPRTARIVLTLALDRLARHYGIELETRGPSHARTRSWHAEGAKPTMDGN
jgi:hypothetical protein